MIIVDTAAWAAYFNGESGAHAERLDEALTLREDLGVVPIILTEVLQGFRTESGFRSAKRLLGSLDIIEPKLVTYVGAARLFREMRGHGVTVRGAVDCLIARTCIDSSATLLSPDADFRHIAAHSKLKLWSSERD